MSMKAWQFTAVAALGPQACAQTLGRTAEETVGCILLLRKRVSESSSGTSVAK